MKKKLDTYLFKIEQILANESDYNNWGEMVKEHLVQTAFFQHERLIHLIVTMIFALFAFSVFIVLNFVLNIYLFVLLALLLCLLIPYMVHYYYLENGVQKLYEQYDRLLIILRKSENIRRD